MKAVERKELQTNALKQAGQNLLHGGLKVPRLVWVLPLIVIVVGVGYWFWSGIAANRTTAVWAYFWTVRDGLDPSAEKQLKGTVAELAYKLDEADRLYNKGYERLAAMPRLAVEDLKNASKLYEEISKTSGASALMVLTALSGAAKCEENLGEVQRAMFFYQNVIDRFGKQGDWTEHPLVRDARSIHEQLAKADTERRTFDTSWLKDQLQMLSDPKRDVPPGLPTEPPPVIPPVIPGGKQ